MPVELQHLTAPDFKAIGDREIRIHFSEEVIATAQLNKVVELPAYSNVERKPFSILLQSDQKDRRYQQGIYRIENDVLGSIEIFLVPVGYNEKGLQYEAVFS